MRKSPDDIATMADLRVQIDDIDAALLALLAERQAHVDRAVALKRAEGISAAAPGRVAEVLDRTRARAASAGVDPDIAVAMWREMIAGFIAREERDLGSSGSDA